MATCVFVVQRSLAELALPPRVLEVRPGRLGAPLGVRPDGDRRRGWVEAAIDLIAEAAPTPVHRIVG
ncbi:MAG: hypothetical protein KDC38_13225 [Planctomycetes bacterium]|nr:hypothetical protein [Planctomycetota bacterium]